MEMLGAFLWPNFSQEPRNAVARMGRVRFYGLAGLAALTASIVVFSVVLSGGEELGMALGIGTLLTVPPYLAGWALCYILAVE